MTRNIPKWPDTLTHNNPKGPGTLTNLAAFAARFFKTHFKNLAAFAARFFKYV